jgi:hypothetical protein
MCPLYALSESMEDKGRSVKPAMQSAIHSRGLSPRHVGQRGNYVRDGDVLLTHGSGRSGKCRTCHLR